MEEFAVESGQSDQYGGEKRNEDFRLYMADSNLKRKIWLSQLTAARMQCTMYEKKIFFGKASPLLAMEHLAATRSLKELQDVFYGSIEGYKDKVANSEANDELWWPPSAPLDLH